MGYGLNGPRFDSGQGQRVSLLQTGSDTHTAPYSVDTGVLSWVAKRPGRDTELTAI
jgi:hypothetical protein